MGGLASDWFGLLFVVAVVYVLVRPSSKAAELVDAVGSLMLALTRRATDLAT